jgi:hypothetical protein
MRLSCRNHRAEFRLAVRQEASFNCLVKAEHLIRRNVARARCVLVAVQVFATTVGFANAAESGKFADPYAPPEVKLRQIERITLNPEPPLNDEETARIKGLIRNLAKIASPDFGLSPTLSGSGFAPIPEAREMGAGLLTDHKIKESEDFAELVRLGPKALPLLLKALDDSTPTKLIIKHDFGIGVGTMWFANEMRGNPGNEVEQKVLATVPKKEREFPEDTPSSYTVKIGDACFVIIGQIVGRSYQAVRYQPTACIVINSPTHGTNIASQVRAIWNSADPPQHLIDSLLLDFASEGVFNGRSLDGWSVGSRLQTGAAMRLLYYFPSETTNLIAARLRSLQVGKRDMYRDVTNRIRTDDFVKAVAWSKEPAVRVELQRIFNSTKDTEILIATAASMGPSDTNAFRERIEEFIRALPETEDGPFGEGYNLLVRLGQLFGPTAKPAFERYMEHASLQRCRSMCRVLAEVRGEWSIDLLAPLLVDTRPAEGWTYAVDPDQNEPRLPIRICDEAADTIARNFPKLSFKMQGEHKDLDAQIQRMSEKISRHDF